MGIGRVGEGQPRPLRRLAQAYQRPPAHHRPEDLLGAPLGDALRDKRIGRHERYRGSVVADRSRLGVRLPELLKEQMLPLVDQRTQRQDGNESGIERDAVRCAEEAVDAGGALGGDAGDPVAGVAGLEGGEG